MKRPKVTGLHFLIHTLFILSGWGVYFFGLMQVSHVPSHVYQVVVLVLGGEFVFLVFFTISWIMRHLMLHRKFGPRQTVRQASWNYEKDWLGYEVKGNFPDLKREKIVIVTCDLPKKTKTFEAHS